MTRLRSTRGFRTSFSARRALLATGLTATAVWACSSSVDLQPLSNEGMGELTPFGGAGAGTQMVSPSDNRNEVPPTPMLLPSGTGGAAGSSSVAGTGTGGSTPMGSAGSGTAGSGTAGSGMGGSTPMMGMAGAPPCADNDQDGRCNEVDRCPDIRDDGTDTDADGLPDACDGCPQLQDDGRDSDGDGKGDACDPCGIGVALGFAPLYYLTLDEDATATTAVNRGSVPQTATYLGPIERGLAGVSDPNGRAIRMAGGANGEFSRVTFTGINVFPRTALTATFWIRTTRVADAGIFSYAITNSQNEFGIFVDADRLRISLKGSSFIAEELELSAFTDGAWHFMALTWQETVAQFYIDGEAAGLPIQTVPGNEVIERVAVALPEGPIELGSPFGAGVLVFGQDQDMLNGGFNADQAVVGGLDELGLYDRALTPEQIRQIYSATTCGEVCDGVDNDNDGIVDEGFLGTADACGASSCAALTATKSAFGSGEYVSTTPDSPLICNF
ncbi:MAG: Bifunctional hemolysin/adenylate cyclase precursor [Pseudomonadota bacterium]